MKQKKNLRQILAGFLATIMIISTGGLSLFALEVRENRADNLAEKKIVNSKFYSSVFDNAEKSSLSLKNGSKLNIHKNIRNNLPTLPVTETNYYGKDELPKVKFSELKYEHYEFSNFQAAAVKFLADIGLKRDAIDAKPSKDINLDLFRDALYEFLEEYDYFVSMNALAQLKYTDDVTNEAASAELTHTEKISNDIFNEALEVLQAVQKNEHCSKFLETIIGDESAKDLAESEVLTAKQKEIDEQITVLQQEYDKVGSSDFDRKAKIYLEIVRLENEYAKESGYDNYLDMNKDNTFGRDYTDEELDVFYESVKKYFSPIYVYLSFMTNFSVLNEYSYPEGETAASIVEKLLGNISSELKEAYDYLQAADMYKLGKSENNEEVSYTITIPAYDTAAIFVKSSSDYHDLSTLIHEFGHFNTAIRDKDQSFFDNSNIDIAEIHSQNLEILFFPYSKIIYGDLAKDVIDYQLVNMLWAILTGCVINEFEVFAYSSKDLTVDMLKEKFKQLAADYKLGLPDTFWADIWHIYNSPLYYISYAVSAVASLSQIGPMNEDYEKAVEQYLKLSSFGQDGYPFKETLEQANYPNIFEEDSIRAIATSISAYMINPKLFDIDDFETIETTVPEESESQETIVPEYGEQTETESSSSANEEFSRTFEKRAWLGDGKDFSEKVQHLPDVLRYIISGDLWSDIAKLLGYGA